MTTRTRSRKIVVTAVMAVAAALLGAGCSKSSRPGYEVTVVFDEVTKPTLPGESRSELRLLGAAPDGTLYIETYVPPGPNDTVWVRSPAGAYLGAPSELTDDSIEAMAFDPVSGDAFALSYPEGRARIRRFHDGRVIQDFTPTKSEGGPFQPKKANDDKVNLFYDSSSGSLLYADGNLYRLDAISPATVVVPRPKPPVEAHDGAGANDNYVVSYAVNPRTGTISAALNYHNSTSVCRFPDAVYRFEKSGRMTRLAGGCVKGKDDYIDGGIAYIAADPASDDLLLWSPLNFHWLGDGKVTEIPDVTHGPVRGVAFDGGGHAYVGMGEKVLKVSFRR